MEITFVEPERSYLFAEIMTLYQNGYYRSLNGALQGSILGKLAVTTVSFTEEENRYCQWILMLRREALTRLTDPRLQHILQDQNNQGFGAPGSSGNSRPGTPNLSVGEGCHSHYFDSNKQYRLCIGVLKKLGS